MFVSDSQGGLVYRCSGCEWTMNLATPASIAAPAVPATTVAATNTFSSVIAATITGGTLTNVSVNGSTVGTTAGTYLVPAGGTISITYSVAPTWTWQLPVTNGSVVANATALPVASGGTYFTAGTLLVVDTAANAEIATVLAGSTGTSIVVAPLLRGHSSGVSFGQPAASPAFSNSGEQAVPQNSY